MTQIDMCQQQFAVSNTIFKPKAIGDKMQGTFIAKRYVPNTKYGGYQIAYDFLQENGGTITVFGKACDDPKMKNVKKGIDMDMLPVRYGQIVGIQYVSDLQTSKGMAHIFKVYADPKVVDEEWLSNADDIGAVEEAFGANSNEPSFMEEETPAPAPVPTTVQTIAPAAPAAPVAPVGNPVAEKLALIKQLVKEQIPGADDNNFMNKVMETFGVPMTVPNYDKILAFLGK